MYIDLTLTVNEELPVYPNEPKPSIKQYASTEKEGWNEHLLTINSHCGTHIDAPWHMLSGAKKLKDFSIDKFIGECILFDVRGQKEINIDTSEVNKGDIVFLRTGHIEKRNQEDYFSSNPIVSSKLAEKLVEKKIKILGIDSPSPDNSPYRIHQILLHNDVLILENLVNLEKITKNRFKVYVLPMKLENDGAPCRVVAEV